MTKFTIALALGALVSGVYAAPSSLDTRQAQGPECTPNSSQGLRPECWGALNMPKFLTNWLEANGTKAGCDTDGFAQCFLKFHGFGGLTCDLITSNTCPPFDTTKSYDSDAHFYALWNIYTIHQFFSQYSQALGDSQSLASGSIAKIVQTVNPPTDANVSPSALGQVLGSTLSFASLGAGAVPGGNALLTGINAALAIPALQKLLFPDSGADAVDNRFVNLADIDAQLSTLVATYQDSLLQTVQATQKNLTNFIAMATDGAFSQRVTTALTVQAGDLYKNLQTFVLSESLKAAGFVIAKSPDTNPVEVAKTTTQVVCPGIGPDGNCFQFFYDATANNAYALHNPADYGNTNIALLDTIKSEKWVPDLKTLFETESCQGKSSSFDAKTLSLDCPVTVKICTYAYNSDPLTEFSDCDSDEDYWPPTGVGIIADYCVAASYLGPLLKNHVCIGPP